MTNSSSLQFVALHSRDGMHKMNGRKSATSTHAARNCALNHGGGSFVLINRWLLSGAAGQIDVSEWAIWQIHSRRAAGFQGINISCWRKSGSVPSLGFLRPERGTRAHALLRFKNKQESRSWVSAGFLEDGYRESCGGGDDRLPQSPRSSSGASEIGEGGLTSAKAAAERGVWPRAHAKVYKSASGCGARLQSHSLRRARNRRR